ncbi:DegT/DnrJ/EryC1/StrS aminotransferase family protein [Flammeovirga sp. EKP202]|uniref:DegT/DnrJ/EryC1/StrS family aminotransferase n=1 Tax=Flammeovirga sp. EKP202 TaxID=2770592 RepID=UPI00165EE910|nr:DegT/DnrJ/EryC1/StrS family aminotransferase [Flammeovirga sp. EKP202]MBD0402227.1 DegT/DnrJ/EryC1/StrS family aminotransferase [Flammeovirga sp. EKP202]
MKNIPFVSLEHQNALIKKELEADILDTVQSNHFILGDKLKKFETEYAAYSNTSHCIGVGNGFDALKLSLLALGIKKGDEVIAPAHTFIATILAIMDVGATPVLVDAHPKTYTIDQHLVEAKISTKTKAIIVVHIYGNPCEMDQLCSIAERNGLFIIEDNAQAQGALYKGHKTGSFGVLNATSFYPAKNLGCFGDGGAITTNQNSLLETLLMLRNYGSLKKYFADLSGCNSRLDEIQAGILSIKLKYLDNWNSQRQKMVTEYKKYLDLGIRTQHIDANSISVYHLFTIECDKRNELQEFLTTEGINTQIHYPVPPHLQKACSKLGYKKGDLPVTEKLSDTLLSLPLYIGLTSLDIQFISEKVNSFYKKNNLLD